MRQKSLIFLVMALLAWGMVPAAALAGLSVEVREGSETIILNTPSVEPYKVFFLDTPDRLVVDLPYSDGHSLGDLKNYTGRLITKVRIGRFDGQTLRVVFELSGKSELVAKEIHENSLHITLTAVGKKPRSVAEKPVPPKPDKPLIIIDPGHGGQDPGAIGPRGTREKDLTLQYGKALRDALVKTGRYRAQLTRDDDRFIVLRERIAIARRAGGQVFISLHADSAPKKTARGLSVYTVSETASDAEAEALAARENKVDILSGMDLTHEREDVADILISLAQRDTKNQSSLLADQLVLSLSGRVELLNNPHRFAGFAVLKAPDIPSVLVEVGFLSHREDEKLLKTASYRNALVSGIISGLDKYFAVKDIAEP